MSGITHEELAKAILENVGGSQNITAYMSCMTRLRIEVADKSQVNTEAIQKLDKVKGVQLTGTVCQIVLFTELEKTYKEFEKLLPTVGENVVKGKRSIVDTILNFCSNVFVPLIPAMIACGLLQGIMCAVDYFGWLDPASSTYRLLDIISDTCVYYYPVLIAFSAARYLKSNPYLTVMIALVMVNPMFSEMAAEAVGAGSNYFSFFGLPVRAATYTSTVFPILCAIWGEYFVEKLIYKYCPAFLKNSIAPLFILVISVPICLCVLAPIGAFINDGFSVFFTWFYNTLPIPAGLLIGAFASILVVFGLHIVILMLAFANLGAFGYDTIMPILFMSNIVVGVVTLYTAYTMKDKEDKAYAITAGLTAIVLGITEPALYGVVIRYKKAIISMICAGAIVGIVDMLLGVKATAVGASGIFGIAAYLLTPGTFVIGCLVAVISGFIISFIMQKSKQS